MLTFIDLHDIKAGRLSGLSFGGKHDTPGSLRIVGGLAHNSEITLDKINAEKLIQFLTQNILGVKNVSRVR